MSKSAVEKHARKYSSSYRYDIEKGKKSSKWTTDFEVMALKTVIKLLLSKWGILSVDMQRAINDDQKVYDENGDGVYEDNVPDVVATDDPFAIAQNEEILEEGYGRKLTLQQLISKGDDIWSCWKKIIMGKKQI